MEWMIRLRSGWTTFSVLRLQKKSINLETDVLIPISAISTMLTEILFSPIIHLVRSSWRKSCQSSFHLTIKIHLMICSYFQMPQLIKSLSFSDQSKRVIINSLISSALFKFASKEILASNQFKKIWREELDLREILYLGQSLNSSRMTPLVNWTV